MNSKHCDVGYLVLGARRSYKFVTSAWCDDWFNSLIIFYIRYLQEILNLVSGRISEQRETSISMSSKLW